MAYGLEVLTQNGLIDISNVFSFRLLKKQSFNLPSGSEYQKFVTMTIPNQPDLGNGPVLLVPYAIRIPNQSAGSIYGLYVAAHKDDLYRSNAQNLPNSITLDVVARTAPSESNPQVLISLYAVQL